MERDIVWEELELNDLLELGQKSIEQQQRDAIDRELRSSRTKVEEKQNKMMKKPSYAVLMNRYESLPNKVKTISKDKLNKLADPILGRMTYLEQRQYESQLQTKTNATKDSSYPGSRIVLKTENSFDSFSTNVVDGPESQSSYHPIRSTKAQLKPIANDAFFMTEAIPEENSFASADEERSPTKKKAQLSPSKIIHDNIKSSKNGFASILRGRVNHAKKLNKLVQPLNLKSNNPREPDDIDRREAVLQAYRDRMEKVKLANQSISRRNQIIMQRSKQRRAQLLAEGSISEEDYNKKNNNHKKGLIRDPLTGKSKKVASSGYGRMVTRYSNQPKPLIPPKKSHLIANKMNKNKKINSATEPESENETSDSIKKMKKQRQHRLAPLDPAALAPKKQLSSSSAPHLPRRNLQINNSNTDNNNRRKGLKNDNQIEAVDDSNQRSSSRQRSRSAGTNNNGRNSNHTTKQLPSSHAADPSLNSSQESLQSYSKRRSSLGGIKAKIDAIMPKNNNSPGKKASPPKKLIKQQSSPGKKPNTAEATEQPQSRPNTEQRAIIAIQENLQEVLKQEENRITADIAMSIQKLQQFENTIIQGDLYTKPDTNATLYKRAEKLGGHLQAAEAILKEYESLRDDV